MKDEEFKNIVQLVRKRCGIDLQQKKTMVEGRMLPFLKNMNYDSIREYLDVIEKDVTGRKVQELINLLTTNHTYFMRESEHFDFLRNVVLPELKEKEKRQKNLRIWCGASSTGEEPYTISMIIHDFLGMEKKEWDSQILATDINTDVLQFAVKGIYTGEQISTMPIQWKQRYFRQIGEDKYQIAKEIRDDVLYRTLNLMSSFPFRQQLHVIFLRNVMIYFDKQTKAELLKRVVDVLAPGGYLFIGTTEGIDRAANRLNYVRPSVYQKPI